jgi:hypothetical protein
MNHLLIGPGGDLTLRQFQLLVDVVSREVEAGDDAHLPDNAEEIAAIETRLDSMLMAIENDLT